MIGKPLKYKVMEPYDKVNNQFYHKFANRVSDQVYHQDCIQFHSKVCIQIWIQVRNQLKGYKYVR